MWYRVGLSVILLFFFFSVWSGQNAQMAPGIKEEPKLIKIRIDGKEKVLVTKAETVESALKEAKIQLAKEDKVFPGLSDRVCDNMFVRVVRVKEKLETCREPIPFQIVYKPSKGLKRNAIQVLQRGEEGLLEKLIKIRYEDGQEASREIVSQKVLKSPKSEIALVGFSRPLASRGGFSVIKVLIMEATGYHPGPGSCGRYASGYTATGLRAGYGVVAVDPRVIPLGTRLYIEGYGLAIAGDVGKKIKGNRIDLGHDTYREAKKVGRKKVKVYILE